MHTKRQGRTGRLHVDETRQHTTRYVPILYFGLGFRVRGRVGFGVRVGVRLGLELGSGLGSGLRLGC